jgi:hypothetical protein
MLGEERPSALATGNDQNKQSRSDIDDRGRLRALFWSTESLLRVKSNRYWRAWPPRPVWVGGASDQL